MQNATHIDIWKVVLYIGVLIYIVDLTRTLDGGD